MSDDTATVERFVQKVRDNMCDGCSRGATPRHEICDLYYRSANLIEQQARTIAELRADRDGLRWFVARIFDLTGWPEGGDLDSCDFQDAAAEHGILTEFTATEACNKDNPDRDCFCEEWDDFPQTCYRKPEWLIEAQARNAAIDGAKISTEGE